ncbi:DUF885 domain-containing protein [Kordiimonas sp. SCSIO 12603]|uniref:DUF885 domain-containing protein n=1 Tax=Kordiimonas sp. SCSIO 12603 TaxID=2829596 RepID=UPI002105D7EF|nr:DUF885 domain-containing protein [Kordiimonas sp. SCSIO 12603]UTW57662.1 DUF885 domain-containing protein [Kordiimonas sp. SCSIO 12603]
MIQKSISTIALVLALAACDAGNQTNKNETTQAAPEMSEVNQNAAIMEFFDEAMAERLALNPLQAERLGDKSNNDKWPEVTDAAAEKMLALYKEQLAALRTFDFNALDAKTQLSYRIFEITAERFLANHQWRHHGYPVNQMFGWQTTVPSHLMTVHSVSNKADAEAYVKRLERVETFLGQVAADMKVRADMGVMAPQFVYPYVITASENLFKGAPFEEGEDGIILANFKRKVGTLNLPDGEEAELVEAATAALLGGFKSGYDMLIAELKREQGIATTDDGAWKFPDGEAFYAQALKNNTTTDMSADEIHQLGLDNVERIHGAMKEIMKQVEFEGSLQDFFAFTRDDPRFYYENTDAGKEEYIAKANEYVDAMRTKVPEYFDLMPKAPMEVRAVEKFRENSAGKAFYQRSAPDGSRPGIFYANLRDTRLMPTYQLEALAYHEGIPGHHFQIAISQELDGVPLFQRTARFTAFSEGWGLYTEELGKDMGFYADPYSDFGRLAMELWRACRLVVDTGLHHKKWTREQAIQYLSDNTPNPLGDNIAAIERYIVMPGQATAYMVGKLKIMELREKARAELGDKFDWRGFHSVVLANGAVPLSILEENVNA